MNASHVELNSPRKISINHTITFTPGKWYFLSILKPPPLLNHWHISLLIIAIDSFHGKCVENETKLAFSAIETRNATMLAHCELCSAHYSSFALIAWFLLVRSKAVFFCFNICSPNLSKFHHFFQTNVHCASRRLTILANQSISNSISDASPRPRLRPALVPDLLPGRSVHAFPLHSIRLFLSPNMAIRRRSTRRILAHFPSCKSTVERE